MSKKILSITDFFISKDINPFMTSLRGNCWSVTINNPQKDDEENFQQAGQRSGWHVYGQLEKGTNGTPHYQLMVTTPQVRFSALKKAFPRAHIELARNKEALAEYVRKEETRIAPLPSQSEMFPSTTKTMDMYGEWCQTYKKGLYLSQDPQGLLDLFDTFVREHIEQGYFMEHIGVNPQVRSSIKLYGLSIIQRALRRQTDRQDREEETPDPEVNEDEGQVESTSDEEDEDEDEEQSEDDCSETS